MSKYYHEIITVNRPFCSQVWGMVTVRLTLQQIPGTRVIAVGMPVYHDGAREKTENAHIGEGKEQKKGFGHIQELHTSERYANFLRIERAKRRLQC